MIDAPEAPPGARQTGPDMELGEGGGGSEREAGHRRNPPLRTRLYPPIGCGARSFTNPPSLWKRSGGKLS